MRKLISKISFVAVLSFVLSACGGGEQTPTMQVVGNYNALSLQVGDVNPPNFEMELNLKEDSTYISSGFDKINPDFIGEGKWSLNAPDRTINLGGMDFAIKKFENDTLKLSCTSQALEFTVTLKR